MSETPAVECPYCWEPVSWDEFPDHLDSHGGDLQIDSLVVSGDPPETVAIGEPTERFVQVVKRSNPPE